MRTHDNTDFVFRSNTPPLTVHNSGGAKLGNCYNASYYEVTSLHPLSLENLHSLRDAGFLGYGQEFMCQQLTAEGDFIAVPRTLDWRTSRDVKPTRVEETPCVMVDRATGKTIEGEAINPYSGKPYLPGSTSVYIYRCESRVDSGD